MTLRFKQQAARESILIILYQIASKVRAIVSEQLVDRRRRRQLTVFFYAVQHVREDIKACLGDLPPHVALELEILLESCSGPLRRFRSQIQRASVMAAPSDRKRPSLRCQQCGATRAHESLPCDGCYA